MRLTGVEIRDFRNLAEVEVFPHRRFNVLVGENGQGKTSFLEALYWLATMLEAGEDPRFIARRIVISASEDVGTLVGHDLFS